MHSNFIPNAASGTKAEKIGSQLEKMKHIVKMSSSSVEPTTTTQNE